MCGRTRLSVPPSDLAEVFDAVVSSRDQAWSREDPFSAAQNLNCAPTDPILVVRRAKDSDVRELVLMRWGLVPFYVHDYRDARPLINARVETVATSRAFRDSFKKRRCLVLADGFYEWRAQEGAKKKIPHVIQRPGGVPFAMAGIWDRWRGKIKGREERIETCSILTCPPSPSLATIHDRMPIALEKADHAAWLDPATGELALRDILARPVSDWTITRVDRMPDSSVKKAAAQMSLLTRA